MARVKQLDVRYFPGRDILQLEILPHRRSGMFGGEYNFFVRRALDGNDESVGFEILDFSAFVAHLHEPGVLPELDTRFDVQLTTIRVDADGTVHRQTRDTGLRGLTLTEVLEWAYHTFILARVPGLPTVRRAPALAPA